MDKSKSLSQVLGTYFWLRFGFVFIGIGFPLLLWRWGKWHEVPLQDSMSAYYWASPVQGGEPVRALFVGGLFVIGSFLFIYKGYTFWEDIVLTLAAGLVTVVALVPMGWNCGSDCPRWSWHFASAIGAFVCLGYVVLFQARKTLDELGNEQLRKSFNILYWVTSAFFFIFPFVVLGWHWRYQNSTVTFWLEASLIFAFALFWFCKSLEMWVSQAERQTFEDAKVGRKAIEDARRR